MKTASQKIFAILVALLLVIPAAQLFAQSSTSGDVAGVVTDPTGAVVPGASVTLASAAKGTTRTSTTTSTGTYRFSLIPPGDYTVTVTAPKFATTEAKVSIVVGVAATQDIKLAVASGTTTVEVTAAAPLINTESADNSSTFEQKQIESLPNGGSDLTYIAQTAPGVVMNTGSGYGNFTANGLPATSNVFTVDGNNDMDPFLNLNNSGPTNLMLGKNSIAEASVITNAYSGQYGQQAGAQVNYVSKGGTNQYHGNAQYQWSGRAMDANDWFNNRGGSGAVPGTPIDRPFANNNQWAASFGGPIKKDKIFFFMDTEGIRYIVPSSVTVYTPTTDFLNATIANVTSLVGTPGGPSAATLATYQSMAKIWEAAPNFNNGTVIPAASGSCTDGFTQAPVTSLPGCIQSYSTNAGLPADEWLLIGRFDWNVTNNDRAFLRFDIDRGVQATYADPINPDFSAASYQPEYQNTLTWTHSFGANATNQFIAGLDYYRAIFNVQTNGTTGEGSGLGKPSPFPYSLYLVADAPVTGLNALNFAFPQGRNVTQLQIIDDYALTKGKHSMKFGVNFRRYDISNYDVAGYTTPLVEPGLTDFFNGGTSVYEQSNPLATRVPENTGGFGIYGQDEWAITQRFKLTVGLRGEHNFNPTCDINCFAELNGSFAQVSANQGTPDPVTGLPITPYDQALKTGLKSAFNSVDTLDLAPRLGFTWAPFNSGKTVVGGGIGIFYDSFPAFLTDQFINLPFKVGVNQYGPDIGILSGVVLPPVYWGDPAGAAAVTQNTANTIRNGDAALGIPSFANGLTASQLIAAGGAVPSVTSFPGTLHTPQYQEWNFSIQQALDSKSSLMVNYVGNHGIHEGYPNATLNASAAAAGGPVFGYPGTVDGRFGSVTQWQTAGLSNYNGLTASYNRRLTYGFVIQGNFTWSHALDEISNGGLLNYNTIGNLQGQLNPLNFRSGNYGNADYDVRESFNASYVWTEPFKFSNTIERYILGGWIVSENFIVRSGLPYTVTDGTVGFSNGGTALPAQVLNPGQNSCVNGNSQCVLPANFESGGGLGYFPTQLRNQYRGPGFFDTDVTVGKDFHITEAIKMNIGANFYNILNHQSFHNPNSAWTPSSCNAGLPGQVAGMCQSTFGQISSVTAPPTGIYGSFFTGLPDGRIVQLQAKITF